MWEATALYVLAAVIFLMMLPTWISLASSSLKAWRGYVSAGYAWGKGASKFASNNFWLGVAVGAFGAAVLFVGAKYGPDIPWPVIVKPEVPPAPETPTKPTAITYVWEKDDGPIPSSVLVAIDKLNRKGITATTFEDDTTDGSGEVPAQYVVPLKAAKEAGLPSLVSVNGDKVLRVVKKPTTEQQVLEIAP